MSSREDRDEYPIERLLLAALVYDSDFASSAVAQLLEPRFFESRQARVVAQAALSYIGEYGSAPGGAIRDVISPFVESLDDDEIELISVLLDRLRDVSADTSYSIKRAEEWATMRRLDIVRSELDNAIRVGDIRAAESAISGYVEARAGYSSDVIDLLRDSEAVADALSPEAAGDVLFRFPGALGDHIGAFERQMLVSIVAPMKRGKSWWLQEFAYQALGAGCRVLLVDLEMSEKQRIRRLYQRILGRPDARGTFPGQVVSVAVPEWDCSKNVQDKCKLPYRRRGGRCTVCASRTELRSNFVPDTEIVHVERRTIDSTDARKRAAALLRGRLRGASLRLISIPTGAANIRDLEATIRNLEMLDGWVPDVIVTDYADLFASNARSNEYRHQIYDIWQGHKRIAQRYNALVVTASQSNTARQETKKRIGQGDWAEDIRKLAIIDVGISLDQTPEEKRKCLMRIGVVAHRHKEFDVLSPVVVRQCYALGAPFLDGGVVLSTHDRTNT